MSTLFTTAAGGAVTSSGGVVSGTSGAMVLLGVIRLATMARMPTGGVTELHAFDTGSPETTRYVGSGSVPGYVMGRWALSRYDGDLRVAPSSLPGAVAASLRSARSKQLMPPA